MDKKEDRIRFKKIRDSLPLDIRKSKSDSIFHKIFNSNFYNKANNIMVYASFGSEVDTSDFINKSIIDGKSIILPRCNSVDKSLSIFKVKNPATDLELSSFGIMEPNRNKCNSFNVKDIDLILVPGLAFDINCNRLGYGAGYYDKFFSTNNIRCIKIGLAFKEQLSAIIPTESHDIPLDFVVTDNIVIGNKTKSFYAW